MAAVQFYHLTATPLERALPKLLEKCVSGGFVTQVLAANDMQVEQLNQLLWTYDQGSFLPHGSLKDGNVEDQPVLLVAAQDAAHPANVLLVTDGRMAEGADKLDRVLDMFDGQDEQVVAAARQRWTAYKNAGHGISYMKQTPQGGWEKAASNG